MKSIIVIVSGLPINISELDIVGDCLTYQSECFITGDIFSRTECISHLFKKSKVKFNNKNKFDLKQVRDSDPQKTSVEIRMYYD